MKFVIKNRNKKIPNEVLKACNGNEFLARLLFNRGITNYEEAINILDFSTYKPYDPNLIPDIDKAVDIIIKGMNDNKKMAVYGDYDTDGVTATTILVDALRNLGIDVLYHVPDRFSEGYGMNLEIVKKLYEEKVDIIITCDCGIANFDEIDLAKSLGMTVVLTDHHNIGESIPNADVVINLQVLPENHKARAVSGCATAYYLVKVLYERLGKTGVEDYLDLVALSTVADVMPLINESRYLFKKGFPLLQNPQRMGIKALFEVSGIENLTEDDIGFQITPRINAAGRMDSAKMPVEMFLSKNYNEALEFAKQINAFNIDRKNIQKEILDEAVDIVENVKKNKKILVIYGPSWHHGIIGIVAGKICETYNKPTIMLTLSEDGEMVVGSARSPENINIYDVLSKNSDYLTKFGGHGGAAGLSLNIDKLEEFTRGIESYADIYFGEKIEKTIDVDMELNLADINESIFEDIESLSPYGEAFLPPLFCSFDQKVISDRVTPAFHHFLVLEDKMGNHINAVIWNGEQTDYTNKNMDISYSIYRDTYKGANELKLKVDDIQESSEENHSISVEIIDEKNRPIEELVVRYKDAIIFYEGPVSFKPNLPVYNLKDLNLAEEVILYSMPLNSKKLKDIIEKTKASKVILNYSYTQNYEINYFTKNFLGYVKYIIANKEGLMSISSISETLNIDNSFVLTFVEFLSQMGYINYKVIGEEIFFELSNRVRKDNPNLLKVVTRYLNEKAEYVKYNMQLKI